MSTATLYQDVLIIHLSMYLHAVVIPTLHYRLYPQNDRWSSFNTGRKYSQRYLWKCTFGQTSLEVPSGHVLPAHWLPLAFIVCTLKHLTVLMTKQISLLLAVWCKCNCFHFTGNVNESMRTHWNPENIKEWHHMLFSTAQGWYWCQCHR